jgi:Nucleotidyl transferase AbiEii toxin, Type IV TA system
MLQTQTIETSTLDLLKSLMSRDYLDGFNLVGGTALALYLGHRKSMDIDLFSEFSFDVAQMIDKIQHDFPLQLYFTSANTIKGSINNTNVDIIAHRYPSLSEVKVFDGIRISSEPDIIAMKLNAISISGQRSKDFIDIYFILEEHKYGVADMLKFYQTKYSQLGDMHVLKSLIYFNDVDLSDWPVLIKKPHLKWPVVISRIEKEVLRFVKEQVQANDEK